MEKMITRAASQRRLAKLGSVAAALASAILAMNLGTLALGKLETSFSASRTGRATRRCIVSTLSCDLRQRVLDGKTPQQIVPERLKVRRKVPRAEIMVASI
ncbi:hypothetical protein [Roseomonas chloroacetimidivorans]|uniref:hypothetical protein n=1 Tax=Roseomonas chloroacetimidivorans TaxID=1766656 RepID=UPI003C7967EC